MRARRAAAFAIVFAVSGCGSAPHTTTKLPTVPEPASAPVPADAPAGRVIRLGGAPEGIVVDAASRLVVVGVRNPPAVAILDRDGKEQQRIPLPAAPRHLEAGPMAGTVLIPEETANRLDVLRPADGHLVASIPVGRNPHDATTAAGRVFVTDEADDTLHVIDASRVTAIVPTPVQPGGVAASGETVVVVGVRARRLQAYDARTLRGSGTVPCGAGPTHIIAGGDGRVFVADTQGDAILAFSVTHGHVRQSGRLSAPGTPYGLAIDPHRRRLWVTLTARNQIIEYDIGSSRLHRIRTWPTVRQPNSVSVDPDTGRVYVTGTIDGVLQILGP